MITTRDQAIAALACWYEASVANIKKSAATPEARLWAANYYADKLAALVATHTETRTNTYPSGAVEADTWISDKADRAAQCILHALISRLTAPEPEAK